MAKTAEKLPDVTTAGAIAPIQSSSSNVAALMTEYKGPVGDETIESEDISIPRLKIGQSMSPEVKDGNIKEGALFINVTGQTLWDPDDKAPLQALIVARNKEFILWRPVEDGGGILARAQRVQDPNTGAVRYKWDQPNKSFEVKVGGKIKQTWTTKTFCGFGKGKAVADLAADEDNLGLWGSEISNDPESSPAATAHHNYLLMLPAHNNLIAAISLSRSQAKVAMNLNAAIKMGDRRYPLPVRKFFFSTVTESTDDFKYKNWKFEGGNSYLVSLGVDANGKPKVACSAEDEPTVIAAMGHFQSFQQGGYKVDQSDGQSDNKTASKTTGDDEDM